MKRVPPVPLDATDRDVSSRRGGRPSPAQAERITERIVDVAARLFFSSGYETTSIDQIAAAASISKRTFYTRFASKADLFGAVVRRKAEVHLTPMTEIHDRSGPLDEHLIRIACALSKIVLHPEVIALDRLVTTEAIKFPELAQALYDIGVTRAVVFMQAVFADAVGRREVSIEDTRFLAEHFLHAIVQAPLRKAVLGIEAPPSGQRLTDSVTRAVRLFLYGCRGDAPSLHL